MRWGIAFLAWVFVGIYLADSCLDYVRIWLEPPQGYSKSRALSHLTACGTRKSVEFAIATAGIVSLYFASGWAIARFQSNPADDG